MNANSAALIEFNDAPLISKAEIQFFPPRPLLLFAFFVCVCIRVIDRSARLLFYCIFRFFWHFLDGFLRLLCVHPKRM